MITKQAEEKFSHKDELIKELNAIFDSVTDGLYITDGKGVTLRVNRAFEKITAI